MMKKRRKGVLLPLLFCVALLLLLLLLAAVVRHRVSNGKSSSRGSVHLIPVFPFSSFKHDYFSMYPLQYITTE